MTTGLEKLDPEQILSMSQWDLWNAMGDEGQMPILDKFAEWLDDHRSTVAIEAAFDYEAKKKGGRTHGATDWLVRKLEEFMEPAVEDFRQGQVAAATTRMAMGHGVGA